jgi:hypothetical protein
VFDQDPVFVNEVSASQAPTTAGDYRLQESSPAIIAGSNVDYENAFDNGVMDVDLEGNPRIVNGVIDAVRHLGVTEIEMPCTAQRVWRAIQDAKGRPTQETPVDTSHPGAGLGSIDPNNPQGEVQ